MTLPKPHPITLQRIVFTRSIVVAVPDHVPTPGQVTTGPENKIAVTKVEGQVGQYSAIMRTTMNTDADKSLPYAIDMECMADLRTDDTLTEDEAMRGVYITAHGVLYGAIREAVAWLTSRQPYGGLMLGLSVLQSSNQAEPAKAK